MKEKIRKYRCRIIVFLFFVTTIKYFGRQLIRILFPYLQKLSGWTEYDYMSIQVAYAKDLLLLCYILNKLRTNLGYTIAIGVRSVASSLYTFAKIVICFSIVRILLGIGQSVNLSVAVKTLDKWFLKREIALATGIFNMGCILNLLVCTIHCFKLCMESNICYSMFI